MRFEFKRIINLMIFVLIVFYISFIQKVHATSATPDIREYEFPNLLINKVSFKNPQHDFIGISVGEYISNESKNLKGLKIVDDNVFLEIEDDILVRSEDKIIIYFKEESESIEKSDGILKIKLKKSGLTGTTEQVILKNYNDIIIDGICWTSDSPTQDEISDFNELHEAGQWTSSNISSCINSENIESGISISRKNNIDTNSANDWEVILNNAENNSTEEIVDIDENTEVNENEITDENDLDEISKKTTNTPSKKNNTSKIENICEENIFINEIMPNPKGKDTGKEWVELINLNNEDCNLDGWQIDDQDGGSKPYLIYNAYIKGGGGFLLLPSWETKLNLNNGEDEVRLINPDNEIVFEITYKSAIDGQSYAMISDNEDEYEWSSMPTPLLSNEFPEETTPLQKEQTKKTSKDNDKKSDEQNIENGTLSNKIYITEIFPNPQGSDSGNEWIEIHNESNEKVDLGNWKIDTGENSKKIFTFNNKLINAGEYITLSDKDLGFTLKNSENNIRLLDFENSIIDQITYSKVIENNSFMKILIEGEEDPIWKWTQDISPKEKNQKFFKYVGKIEDFDEINGILSLKTNDTNGSSVIFHVIQSGDNLLQNVFTKDLQIQIIAVKKDDKLIMETYKVLEESTNVQNDKSRNSGIGNSLYALISFLPPLGFIGYFGVKKFGLIKFI